MLADTHVSVNFYDRLFQISLKETLGSNVICFPQIIKLGK